MVINARIEQARTLALRIASSRALLSAGGSPVTSRPPKRVCAWREARMAPKLRWFLLAALLVATGSVRAADEFPYTAYVAVEGAEVVAGPGQRFYATERLKRGTAIEIYREEASGWLAIRPTEASFSWVPAQHIER